MPTLLLALLAPLAHAGDLSFGYVPMPGPGEKPALLVTPAGPVARMTVRCEAGGKTYDFTKGAVAEGSTARFEWTRDPSVTAATCQVVADFTDGHREDMRVPITWSFSEPLSIDLAGASADLAARTLSVTVTGTVETADITAYGAHKAVLDQRTVQVGAGPGRIEVPWVGDPGEIVLLDVTLRSGGSWAGFTYSPWFLDIPHDDVLFDTNEAVIRPEEEPKLEATLAQLRDVIDKYGAIVPVHLYVAGCTDTVGDAGSNADLSRRRAQAIASWLRKHGYSLPIAYHGFGEGWLAVPTPDGTNEPRNRRAVYMVGAAPPPPSSGVPQVSWTNL